MFATKSRWLVIPRVTNPIACSECSEPRLPIRISTAAEETPQDIAQVINATRRRFLLRCLPLIVVFFWFYPRARALPSGTMSRAASLAVAGASIAALVSLPSLRSFVAKWSGYNAPGGVWRILAILFALANLKNLPFMWHVRPFRSHSSPPTCSHAHAP